MRHETEYVKNLHKSHQSIAQKHLSIYLHTLKEEYEKNKDQIPPERAEIIELIILDNILKLEGLSQNVEEN